MAEPTSKAPDIRRVRFDGTITAGNVLTMATILVAVVLWGARMEGLISTERMERARFEAEVNRKIAADDMRERDAFAEVRSGIRRIENILLRLTASPQRTDRDN